MFKFARRVNMRFGNVFLCADKLTNTPTPFTVNDSSASILPVYTYNHEKNSSNNKYMVYYTSYRIENIIDICLETSNVRINATNFSNMTPFF